jgi:hypothetical protein
MGLIGRPKTSVNSHQHTSHNIREERRPKICVIAPWLKFAVFAEFQAISCHLQGWAVKTYEGKTRVEGKATRRIQQTT